MTKEQVIELIKEYKVAKVEFPNDLQEQALDMDLTVKRWMIAQLKS